MQIPRPKSKQPLPPHAKRIFQGQIFDVYQWQQPMYDGTTATFEKLVRPDTVMVIPITTDNKIIITHQEQPGKEPFIGLAGGRLDPGEDPLDGAKRELLEETGFHSDNYKLFDAVQPISKVEWAVYTFIAQGCKKVSRLNLDAGEKITLEEVTFEQFVDMACLPEFAELEVGLQIMRAKLSGNLDTIKQQFFE